MAVVGGGTGKAEMCANFEMRDGGAACP